MAAVVWACLWPWAGAAAPAKGFRIASVRAEAEGPAVEVALVPPVAVKAAQRGVRLFPHVDDLSVEAGVEEGRTVLRLEGRFRRGARYLVGMEAGSYRTPWFTQAFEGLEWVQEDGLDPGPLGVRLVSVPRDSAAARQGLRSGDIVVRLGATDAVGLEERRLLHYASPLVVTLLREGRQSTVTLRREAVAESERVRWLAATFAPVRWQRLGCRVERLPEGGPLARAGLRRGDVILDVVLDGEAEPIATNATDAARQRARADLASRVALRVRRRGEVRLLELEPDTSAIPFAGGERAVTIPDAPPRLTWFGKGGLVERIGRQLVHLEALNADETVVEVVAVPPAAAAPAAKRADAWKLPPQLSVGEVRRRVEAWAGDAPAPFGGETSV
ncbi:MAG: hypothetical protein D6739_06985, partial [Nitrospirae bacterium]